jgi:general secretion pathway protein D
MRRNVTILFFIAIVLGLIIQQPTFAKAKEAKEPAKVTFNFVDVDLPAITKFISDITKKNFIFDDRLKGKITIIAPSKLSVDEAFNLFTSVLELKGFTVVPSGVDAYKIIPSSEAKQRGIEIATDRQPVNESYIARLIPLKNISSDDALKFLQPIVSRDGYASAFGPGNLLLVIDSGLNMEKILSIVESIDQPSMREGPEIIFLKHASADAVAKMLNEGMSRRYRVGHQPSAFEEGKAVADQRLNAVVLFGDKGMRESMKSLIELLDVPSAESQGRINVYFLENADATELAKVIEGMIKGVNPQPSAKGAAPVTPFEAPGGITITADKASNALIIVASPSDQKNLLQVIKQLDVRRRQVYVEAMIVEASMDKLRSLGTQWRATAKSSSGAPIAIGGFGTITPTDLTNILQGLEGASVGGLGNFLNVPFTSIGSDGSPVTSTLTVPGYAALFSLQDFKDAVNILSTPQILTSDNKEAEILVGENVPFISQTQTGVSTSTSVLNSIVRQDVGIILRITPQITEGDHVKLDIYEEISSVKGGQSDQVTTTVGPTITKRSTKTSVVVKDSQTVVIGGLMQEHDEETVTKMPILGDIPILGWLFKQKNVTKNKINLLVFLTPSVVKEPTRLAEITKEKEREFGVSERRYAASELLVKFKKEVSDATAREIISKEGATVIKFLEGIKVYQIHLKKGQDVEDAIKEFSKKPEVEYAEPNYIVRMQQR